MHRNGIESMIPQAQLTVGDMIHLQDGDIIPADCAVIFTMGGEDLLVDETHITGEPDLQRKSSLSQHQYFSFSNHTIVYAQSRV